MENELNVEEQVPSGILTSITISILDEEDAKKMSVKVIEAAADVTHPELGLPNPTTSECPTCGAKDVRTCEGHCGLIKFPFTILHPYYISEIAQILNKICPGCKSLRADKVKNSNGKIRRPGVCKYCDVIMRDIYPNVKFKVTSDDIFGKTAIIAEIQEKSYKRSFKNLGFHRDLAFDFWDFVPNEPQTDENSSQPKKKVLSHAQVYHMLKDVDPEIIEGFVSNKDSILLNCFPVTPNCHRVSEFMNHMIFDKYTKAYRKLIDYRGPANELSTRVLECLKLSKIRVEKLSVENQVKYESASTMSGLKYIKELILGKRSDHSFRMVVIGDPNIKLDEIGIPCHIAESMQISERVNKLNHDKLSTCCELRILEKGEAFVRRKDGLKRLHFASFKDKLQTGDIVYRPLQDNDIVLINRPPSIHPHSLIGLKVKILPINSVLSINPLICSPFRGDFDGDCLHGYVPQSLDSIVELRELVGLNKQLIDTQSGKNLLSLSHDSLTAAHLVLEDGVFVNDVQMQQLQMFCPRFSQNPAVTKSNSSKFWTGRQLFSLLFPPGFEYESENIRISKGEVLVCPGESSWLQNDNDNIFFKLVKEKKEEVLDFLFEFQEVLCEWLSMRGLSVSLSDLYLSSDSYSRKNMIDEVISGLQEAERISYIKLLMVDLNRDFLMGGVLEDSPEIENLSYEKQKSASLSREAVSAFKKVFWDIQNLAYHYAGKENSFMAMLKAGSKGNLVKMVQHGMCLGVQHSLVPLSFKIPEKLTCATWNYQKMNLPLDTIESYIPYAVVESSFLTGLNPFECFVHSLTNRDSSFGGHADISGTLTRRLMFFMRDLYLGYDGTVRNPYGNQLIQFCYNNEEMSEEVGGGSNGSQPVGPLAACAISEAAYSALDQPISVLQSSPLLTLKKVLECGLKKASGDKTASMFLSKKLGRWFHGFEYGALEVKNHLERVLLSEIVSSISIFYSPQTSSSTPTSPWVCHFHISKEVYQKKRLNMRSIVDALYAKCNSTSVKPKPSNLNLRITSNCACLEADVAKENDGKMCVTVRTVYRCKNSSEQLDELRDTMIPFLLGTVVKGSANVKKVEIIWKDSPNVSRNRKGELYLQVFMSESCDRKEFWRVVKNDCLRVWDMIDWERSHPDIIHDITSALGIDVARDFFISSLNSAVLDTGKSILPEHLLLTADCLSFTGEFVALSAKGLSQQRKHTSVSSPFVQACFSNPGDCLIKAAKVEAVDNLQGSVDSLTWGKVPSIGTGGHFEILFSGKGHELDEPSDIYNLLGNHMNSRRQNAKVKVWGEYNNNNNHASSKDVTKKMNMNGGEYFGEKGQKKHTEVSKAIKRRISSDDIRRLSQALRNILHRSNINQQLSEVDKSIVMTAFFFHPKRDEKLGSGIREVKVGYHPKHGESRCFLLVRTDGTVEDFSYHKCVYHALELIDPGRAKSYHSRWLKGKDVV